MSDTETQEKTAGRRMIADLPDDETIASIAATLGAGPGLEHVKVHFPMLPELLGLTETAWASARTLDGLRQALEEEIALSNFLVGITLRPGDLFVRAVRGLVFAPGVLPNLHEGVLVIANDRTTQCTSGVIVFDPGGFVLCPAPFQTAPPACASHARRWFARRWSRSFPTVPIENPYPVLTNGMNSLGDILAPLVVLALEILAAPEAPVASA